MVAYVWCNWVRRNLFEKKGRLKSKEKFTIFLHKKRRQRYKKTVLSRNKIGKNIRLQYLPLNSICDRNLPENHNKLHYFRKPFVCRWSNVLSTCARLLRCTFFVLSKLHQFSSGNPYIQCNCKMGEKKIICNICRLVKYLSENKIINIGYCLVWHTEYVVCMPFLLFALYVNGTFLLFSIHFSLLSPRQSLLHIAQFIYTFFFSIIITTEKNVDNNTKGGKVYTATAQTIDSGVLYTCTLNTNKKAFCLNYRQKKRVPFKVCVFSFSVA